MIAFHLNKYSTNTDRSCTRVKSLFDETRAPFHTTTPWHFRYSRARARSIIGSQQFEKLKTVFWNFFFFSFYHFPFTFSSFPSLSLISPSHFACDRDTQKITVPSTPMEEKQAAASESAHAESNGISHGSDHGWQKVTYAKKQKKKTNNTANGSDSRANSNKLVPNGTLSGSDAVFRSLELQSEDRRRKILEARKAADAAYDDDVAPGRSKQRTRNDEEDDEDDENVELSAENGKAEEKKVKQKKPKKPKVTVAEAAAKIDSADLGAFLVDISVGHCQLNRAFLGFVLSV